MKELFLSCALALQPFSYRSDWQDPLTKESFFRQYHWLQDLLKKQYPGCEFLIIPNDLHTQVPKGWKNVPLGWQGHKIYRRRIERVFA